jgi:ABC-type phosphate transport system substrate-binding protein
VSVFSDTPLIFIINEANPVESISRRDLVDFYEKHRREWPDGVPVRFIDQPASSSERQTFMRDVLHMSASDVDLFWFGEKFRSGASIPIQVASDDLVIEMVKSFPGAIGYVSSPDKIKNQGVKEIHLSGSSGGSK